MSYRIENGTVQKALGPWPANNWSWISFYIGSTEDCELYIKWVQRIDAGDEQLIKHARDWFSNFIPVEHNNLDHLPLIWGYDFKTALSLFPPLPPEPISDTPLLICLAITVCLVVAFIWVNV